jgi:hypothetical protein
LAEAGSEGETVIPKDVGGTVFVLGVEVFDEGGLTKQEPNFAEIIELGL